MTAKALDNACQHVNALMQIDEFGHPYYAGEQLSMMVFEDQYELGCACGCRWTAQNLAEKTYWTKITNARQKMIADRERWGW
ncbi:hypothetical protein [Auritidibacter sp. NML100628]|uniref:hypothetical protein n=1 Tax=Auritidibacter sp. NML100628 TaxID=2170742 RepID=UPI000D72E3B8|nr:hypothetical protein [Auritidibacter sp. NML100628]PXA77948.1 hypothetical protein DCC24_03370 [Auritidibacter sp. NML100628]